MPSKMRFMMPWLGAFIGLMMLVASVAPVRALTSPVGVWIPVPSHSEIKRIHISGSRFNYTVMIDYSCGNSVCSTLQDLTEDITHPLRFSVRLEGVASMPMLDLRWQRGPPCNRGTSDDNLLVLFPTTIAAPPRKTQTIQLGAPSCFARQPQGNRRPGRAL